MLFSKSSVEDQICSVSDPMCAHTVEGQVKENRKRFFTIHNSGSLCVLKIHAKSQEFSVCISLIRYF